MPDDTPQQQAPTGVMEPLSKAESLSADTSRWSAVKDWIRDFHELPSDEFDAKWAKHPLTDYFISPKWQERLKGLIPLGPEAERLGAEAEKRFPGVTERGREELRGAIVGAVQPGALGTPMVGVVKPPGLPGPVKSLAKRLGLEFRGWQEGAGNHPGLGIFQDPESGTSIGVRRDEMTPAKLQEHTDAARARMAGAKKADFSDLGGQVVREAEPESPAKPAMDFSDLGGQPVAKPTPEATVAEGGRGALSAEELARNEVFVKYGRGGQPTYLGKQPDAQLKQGEAVLAVNKTTGEVRVQNTAGLADSDALAKFGEHAKETYAPEKPAEPTEPIGKTSGWLTREGEFSPLKPGEGHLDALPEGSFPTVRDALDDGHVRVVGRKDSASFEAERLDDRTLPLLAQALKDAPPEHRIELEFHKPKYSLREFDSPEDAVDWLNRPATEAREPVREAEPEPEKQWAKSLAEVYDDTVPEGTAYYVKEDGSAIGPGASHQELLELPATAYISPNLTPEGIMEDIRAVRLYSDAQGNLNVESYHPLSDEQISAVNRVAREHQKTIIYDVEGKHGEAMTPGDFTRAVRGEPIREAESSPEPRPFTEDEPPKGYIRIYRGVNPERNRIASKDPSHGYWFTTTYEDAVNYANWDYEGTGELGPDRAVLAVDVPLEKAYEFAKSGSRRQIRSTGELMNPDSPVEMLVDDDTAKLAGVYEGDKTQGELGKPVQFQKKTDERPKK